MEGSSTREAAPARASGILAVVLAVPAVLFVGANVLKYNLGVASLYDSLGFFTRPSSGPVGLFRDALVMVGAVASLVLSVVATTRAKVSLRDGALTGTLRIRLSALHLTALVLSAGSLSAICLYLLVENVLAGR